MVIQMDHRREKISLFAQLRRSILIICESITGSIGKILHNVLLRSMDSIHCAQCKDRTYPASPAHPKDPACIIYHIWII